MSSIKGEFLVSLILLYSLFVVGDILTTFWLINYYPGGISGEANPFAYLLFKRYGYLGMIISKTMVFLVSSTIFIILYGKYSKIKWFKEALEIIILGLTGLSAIVIVNNLFSIVAISVFIYGSKPVWLLKVLISILSIVIVGAVSLMIFKNTLYVAESVIGSTISIFPLIFWPDIDPVMYLTYIITLFIIIVISIYYIELFVIKRS